MVKIGSKVVCAGMTGTVTGKCAGFYRVFVSDKGSMYHDWWIAKDCYLKEDYAS